MKERTRPSTWAASAMGVLWSGPRTSLGHTPSALTGGNSSHLLFALDVESYQVLCIFFYSDENVLGLSALAEAHDMVLAWELYFESFSL